MLDISEESHWLEKAKEALLNELKDIVQNSMYHPGYDDAIEHKTADVILDIDKYRNRANQMATMIFNLPNTHNGPLDSIKDAVYLVTKVAPKMYWWTVDWNNCQGHWASIKVDVRIGNENEVFKYEGYSINGAASLVQALTKYLDDKPRLENMHETAMKKGERELEDANI